MQTLGYDAVRNGQVVVLVYGAGWNYTEKNSSINSTSLMTLHLLPLYCHPLINQTDREIISTLI